MRADLVVLNTEGRVQYASDEFLRAHEFALAQVIERRPSELWGGHTDREVYARVWSAIEHGKPYIAPMNNKTASGKGILLLQHIVPVTDTHGENRYALGFVPRAGENVSDFSREFLSVWGSRGEWNTLTFAWCQRVLDTPFSSQESGAECVSTTFVDPVRRRFSERYEDAALIRHAREEHAEFGVLYTKYARSVYLFILPRVHNDREKAEDILQETFLRAFRYIDSFEVLHASYRTYLFRVAHSCIVSTLRSERVRTVPIDETCEPRTKGGEQESLHVTLLFERAKTRLSSSEYRAATAFYLRGESVHDIAIGMNKTDNAIKLLLVRSRKKLRDLGE